MTSRVLQFRALHVLFLFSWFPVRGVFLPIIHLLPVLFMIVMVFRQRARLNIKALVATLAYVLVTLTLLYVQQSFTYVLHYLIFLILVFPIFIVLVDVARPQDEGLYKFLRLMAVVTILEFAIGMVQLLLFQGFSFEFKDHAWDQVTGTTMARSSHTFSIKMLLQAIILAVVYGEVSVYRPKSKTLFAMAIGLGIAGALMSSFMLGVLLTILGILLIFMLNQLRSFYLSCIRTRVKLGSFIRTIKWSMLSILVLCTLGFIFVKTQPGNANSLFLIFSELSSLDLSNAYRFQKLTAFFDAIRNILMESWGHTLFGTGAGQFSSRAALILSGEYLYPQPSYLPISMTEETYRYIYPLWNAKTIRQFGGSVLAMPTSSLQAVIIELGVIGLILLGYLFSKVIFYTREHISSPLQARFLAAVAIVAFVSLLQFSVELWLEYASFTVFLFTLFIMSRSLQRPLRSYENSVRS